MEQAAKRYGKSRETERIIDAIKELRRTCNVVAPPGLAGVPVPDGFSVLWSEVDVDKGDIYAVSKGKWERDPETNKSVMVEPPMYTLTASALDRVSASFGINWDPERSCRLDDGRTQHLCEFRAVGIYTGNDGMPAMVSGTNRTDLRDGSPQAESFRNTKTKVMNEAMLRQQRQFFLAIAESKARARAFRKAIGLKGMFEQDILRPWVVFRLVLTGETDDPATALMYKRLVMTGSIQSKLALFGAPSRQLAAPVMAPALPAAQFDDDEYDDPVAEMEPPSEPKPKALPAPQAAPQPEQPAKPPPATQPTKGNTPITTKEKWPWPAKKEDDPVKGALLTEVSSEKLKELRDTSLDAAEKGGEWENVNRRRAKEVQCILDSCQEPDVDEYAGRKGPF